MRPSLIRRRLLSSHLLLVSASITITTLLIAGGDGATPWVALGTAGLGALAIALGLALALARAMAPPIAAMIGAARAMSHGDFATALPPPPDGELGDLVRALAAVRGELAGRLEQQRRESEKLRAVLDGMSEGVALLQDERLTLANPAFAHLLGATTVEGRLPIEAARVPDLAAAIEEAARRRTVVTREIDVLQRTLALRVLPLGTAVQGEAVVVLLDITEARRLDRVRRDFIANASHELRTPVAAIAAAAETLIDGAGDDPQARASFLRILDRHAHRLSRLTADLLDLSRLEAGYRPRTEAVAVAAAVQAVAAALAPRAAAKSITITQRLPADLPLLLAEPAAVEQILDNLVDNAIKYTPSGGRIEISAGSDGDLVRISVADSGPGIASEHHARLFERFYRVDEARSRDLGGTGLGLAIVRHLAIAHGGDVAVECPVGGGSRFTFRLPRA